MCYHTNTLMYYDEGGSKSSNSYHTKKITLVILEDKFVCHDQVIMTSKYQRRKLRLDIYRIYTYHDSDIIGCHRNALLPDEGINKVS